MEIRLSSGSNTTHNPNCATVNVRLCLRRTAATRTSICHREGSSYILRTISSLHSRQVFAPCRKDIGSGEFFPVVLWLSSGFDNLTIVAPPRSSVFSPHLNTTGHFFSSFLLRLSYGQSQSVRIKGFTGNRSALRRDAHRPSTMSWRRKS